MYFESREEEEQKLRKHRAADNRTFNLILDLIISNAFTTHELLVLIKYLLNHHPYSLDIIPPAYREILKGKPSSPKR